MLTYPDYRGAKHYNVQPLPLPYLVYRGEVLRVSRDGVRARLFASDRLDVSLSAAFSLPGNSDTADSPRAGMPELMPAFEMGPSFDYWIHDGDFGEWDLRLRVPVRAVGASDFEKFKHLGWLASPHLHLDRRVARGPWIFHFTIGAGALWANHGYHAYFYDVAPDFATAQRPSYSVRGGYSGARSSLFLGARRGNWGAGLGVLHDWLGGAVFEDSPLVQTRNSAVIGLAFTYSLWQSGERVGSPETVGE